MDTQQSQSSNKKKPVSKAGNRIPKPRSPETSIQATAGTGANSGRGRISPAPVSGWNSQKGSDLVGEDGLPPGNNVEFSSEVGSGSETGGDTGIISRSLNNHGMGMRESSENGAGRIPASAFAGDQRDSGADLSGDVDEDSGLRDQILSKIRDLGDSLDRATDRIAGDSKIGDAIQNLKGRFSRTHQTRGGDSSNRDHQI